MRSARAAVVIERSKRSKKEEWGGVGHMQRSLGAPERQELEL